MGRKPVLALAGALATSLALTGCQTSSNSQPPLSTQTTVLPTKTQNGVQQAGTPGQTSPYGPGLNAASVNNAAGSQQLNTGNPGIPGSANLPGNGQAQSFNGTVPAAPTLVPTGNTNVKTSALPNSQGPQLGQANNGPSVNNPGGPVLPAASANYGGVVQASNSAPAAGNLNGAPPATNGPTLGYGAPSFSSGTPYTGTTPAINTSTRMTQPEVGMPPGVSPGIQVPSLVPASSYGSQQPSMVPASNFSSQSQYQPQ
jgi:hypothetical protein